MNLPLLVLPKGQATSRQPGSQRFFGISVPSPKRQQKRLGSKFARIEELLAKRPDQGKVSADATGIYPDRTIVFELAAPQIGFKKAAEKIGLTWVGEDELDVPADQDFYQKNKNSSLLEGRAYLTSPDERALNSLLRLWKAYTNNNLQRGEKNWADLFSHLKDIRRWGPKDRLPLETFQYLDSIEEGNAKLPLRLEIEAIFTGSPVKDFEVQHKLRDALIEANALILDSVTITEIRYHAVLVEIPKSEIKNLRDYSSALLRIDEVGYILPQSLSVVPDTTDDSFAEQVEIDKDEALAHPVAALFDGVPIANHELLANRIIIDDPNNLQSVSPVDSRRHGTAMASLILHGDLALNEPSLSRKLLVHCLLCATAGSGVETTSSGKLIIGLIYDAVLALRQSKDPAYQNVCIINLSLGDCNRPFTGQMTPWARLLDYLAWKHSILFVVSAGNIKDSLPLIDVSTIGELKGLSAAKRREVFIKAWEGSLARRTLFSPAESVNALTVGALHSDGSDKLQNSFLVDPFDSDKFPSLITGLGLGYKRSIKPDILHCGGRVLYSYTSAGELLFAPSTAVKYFGQQVAGVKSLNFTTRMVGTSNAAALVTRGGIQLYDMIQDLKAASPELHVNKQNLPCLLKALIVHSASWGEAGKHLEEIIQPRDGNHWQARRTNISRFLGYGAIDFSRVLSCTEHRVTLIGTGSIASEKAEIFEFPLPPALSGSTDVRRLTITLAWMTPVKPGEYSYRASALEFYPENKLGYPIGTKRAASTQPPGDATKRGTVVHEVFEGRDAVPIVEGNKLRIRVESKAQGSGTESVPFAIAITFEVASTIEANVYQEIASRIRVKPPTRVRV